MYIKYFADDNTEFDDEFECKQYEREKKLNALENPFMWNQNGEATDDLESAYYLKVENAAQAEAVYLKSDYAGLAYPEDIFTEDEETLKKTFHTGSWYYSQYDDEWHRITDRIEELKKEMFELGKYL